MKNVYIHIGLCKTGTTGSQHLFYTKRCVLKRLGLNYPEAGVVVNHHYEIASSFLDNGVLTFTEAEQVRLRLYRELSEWTGDALLSSEHFSFFQPTQISALRAFLGDNVTIIVVLRDQISWACAMYAESVRWRPGPDFANVLNSNTIPLDYDLFMAPWESVFGRERIRIIPYNGKDIAPRILSSSGVSCRDALEIGSAPRLLSTLPGFLVEVQRRNCAGHPNGFAIEPELWKVLDEARDAGLRPAQQTRIPRFVLTRFAKLDESNANLARRYALPILMFGRSVFDLLEENQNEGYLPSAPLQNAEAWMSKRLFP